MTSLATGGGRPRPAGAGAGSPAAVDDTARSDERIRRRAGVTSLLVGIGLLGAKYWAYVLTGSTAVLSDALESIVNVVAALFALGGLVFAGRPADRNHPYGHGKIEFFSAGFEGGLIAFAAVMILGESFQAFVHGSEVRNLDAGMVVVLAAGVANLLLGRHLVRTGTRHHSLTLVADGRHVMSDFWTSVGVVVGLLLVRLTGVPWLDPLVAAIVALNLMTTGFHLVRYAAGGLLDEEDTELLGRLTAALDRRVGKGLIRVHHLRAIRAGRFHHVEAHLVVPEFWPVDRAHELGEDVTREVIRELGLEGQVSVHLDPCLRLYCSQCDLEDCRVRAEPFRGRTPITIDEAVRPDVR